MRISSPFQTSLYITNLPPTISPRHIDHILARPPRKDGLRSKQRESGVKLIQIYTLPLQPSRLESQQQNSHSKYAGFKKISIYDRLWKLLRTSFCLSGSEPVLSRCCSPQQPLINKYRSTRETERNERGRRVVEREVDLDEEEDNGEVEDEQNDELQEDEKDTKTVAYIHFCCEHHLMSGKRILTRLNIDGYALKIQTKRWNSGIVKRWTRPLTGVYTKDERESIKCTQSIVTTM
ncbi:hypothetical protein L204_100034 [Cryptococcus depauperatus]|nr:hypothetical protein L204_02485 [Cryptococcus depauperatus CBS 7855]